MERTVALEQIVKKDVPFTGVYESNAGFVDKGRIIIPKGLVFTLKARQKAQEKGEIDIFYRLHIDEIPKYLELTDFLPKGRSPNFARYKRVYDLDESSRILISPDDLKRLSIEEHKPIVFMGWGDKIFVYKAEEYERYRRIPYSLRVRNFFTRVAEGFYLPYFR